MFDSWINYYCKTLFITRCEIIGTKFSDMIAHQFQKLLYVSNQHSSIRNIMIMRNAILIYFTFIWYLIGKILRKFLITISISMHNIYSIQSNASHWFVFSGEKKDRLHLVIANNYTKCANFHNNLYSVCTILHALCIQMKYSAIVMQTNKKKHKSKNDSIILKLYNTVPST